MIARRIATAGWLIFIMAGGCQITENLSDSVGKTFRDNDPAQFAGHLDSDSADKRVQGLNEIADRSAGLKPPYTDRYAQLAKTDPDILVRATAIRSLNRARDQSATPIFIQALSDPSPKIRLEACKALVNIPDPNSVNALLYLVRNTDEDKDVRIAAADALKHYKTLEVARALAGTLGEREFSVSWQSRQSLSHMMGIDLFYSEPEWLNYFAGPQKPFG